MESALSLFALCISLAVLSWLKSKNSKAHPNVPTMGPEDVFSSYLGALEYLKNAPKIIQAGYTQHRPGIFRVPYPDKWMYVLSSPQLIADLHKAPEDALSSAHGFGATLAVKYTLGMGFVERPYHEVAVRRELTRSSNERLGEVWDEVVCAFGDEVGMRLAAAEGSGDGPGWVAIPALETVLRIVSRTSNRIFIGVELCRNTDYRDLTIEYAENVIKRARIINLFPDALKPIVGPLVSPLRRGLSRASKHLVPIIGDRLEKHDAHESDEDCPDDLISWLLTHSPPESPSEKTVPALIQRIMQITFLAVHTTANSFTQALYHAAEPRYVGPLREEVEDVLSLEAEETEGGGVSRWKWSQAALGRCVKLDSFLRESQRFNGVSAINMHRKIISPTGFTFSDGTCLPVGTYITAATYALHHDEANYEDPEVFDGFRFARMRMPEGVGEGTEGSSTSSSSKYQMSKPDPAFLAFGLGKHACPGRFFAVTELKFMLAYILLHYDVRLESEEGVRPPREWFGTTCGANRSARVLFRKRFAA